MKKYDSEEYRKIHENAKEQFRQIDEFEGNERDLMEEDKIFSLGREDSQWLEDDSDSRKRTGRSYLTIMRSNQFTDYIKNQQRQNKPSIKISPTDEGAQEEAARLRQGLVRHIQYESKANQARQAGFEDAVDEGRGHWIVKLEDVEGTFHRKIVIEPIQDSRSVFMDWRRQRPDYSDCKYGFVTTRMARKEYEEKYPHATMAQWDKETTDLWVSEKDVMLAEYYCEKYRMRTLLEIKGVDETGQEGSRIVYEDELEREISEDDIIQSREVEEPYWMWYKMSGEEILDEEELPWKEIPIITVIGKENIVDGEWSCKGLIRDIKQPLRLYNFLSSNEADIIAKAPRAPWVGAAGQFEGFENQYANSNVSDEPFLEYNMKSIGNQLAPPPQRAQLSVDLRNILQAKQECIEDIKAITGIYDASVGNRSNETSGVAIRARESQGNNANFHYVDNYAMAINHEGRVINSALDIVYDTKRTITIMGEDDEEAMEAINQGEEPSLGTGNFNTTVSVGPSFNTQREEQAAGMMEMVGNSAVVQEIGMGRVVRAQDWNGAQPLADLLDAFTSMKYPALAQYLNSDAKDDETAILQQQLIQCKQQLEQAAQQAQQLQEALQKADADKQASEMAKGQAMLQELDIKRQELQLRQSEIQGELAIKQRQLDIDIQKADLESETKLEINSSQLQTDLIKTEVQSKQVPPAKETPKTVPAPKQAAPVVNVYGSKKKISKVTLPDGKTATVETVEDE